MVKRWSALAALLLSASAVPARAADPGLTVLNFLKIGVGARAESFGEAYVAVVSDASATYWNPSGLLGIQRNDAQGSHLEWIQDLRQEYAAFGFHRGRHAFGLSFLGLFTGDIEGRTETGDKAGSFGYSDNAFGLTYAFGISEQFGVGGTARYVRQSLVSVPTSVDGSSESDFVLDGMAFDVGGTWWTPVNGLTAAATLRNFGGQVGYDFDGAGRFDLPTTLQAGLAYGKPDLGGGALTLAGDVVAASGDDASIRLGAEYAYRGVFRLASGYKTGLDNENVSFGLGYTKKIQVHYAFTPIYSDLGNSHQITLGYTW
jgi:hypothetical protein